MKKVKAPIIAIHKETGSKYTVCESFGDFCRVGTDKFGSRKNLWLVVKKQIKRIK